MKKTIPMIIVCGGRGKRLGNLTKKIPKPMIKINKQPLLKQKIDYYKKIGIGSFYLCIGYKGEIIKNYFKNYLSEIFFSKAGIRSGILKRIFKVLNNLNDPAIISYGDTLAKINLKKLYEFHIKSKSLMTIVASTIKNPFGIIEYNSKSKLIKFIEKPLQNYFIGYAVFSPKIINIIPKKIINLPDSNGIVSAIELLLKKKKVSVFKFDGLQFTVNSTKELLEANIKFNKYFTIDE